MENIQKDIFGFKTLRKKPQKQTKKTLLSDIYLPWSSKYK